MLLFVMNAVSFFPLSYHFCMLSLLLHLLCVLHRFARLAMLLAYGSYPLVELVNESDLRHYKAKHYLSHLLHFLVCRYAVSRHRCGGEKVMQRLLSAVV